MLVIALCTGCTRRKPQPTAEQMAVAAAQVQTTPTQPQHALDVHFDDKLVLRGYDLNAESWAPGQTVRVTWHWFVHKAPGDGWKLFTHIVDRAERRTENRDAAGVLRGLYEPGAWKTGEYVRDPQELILPTNWSSKTAQVRVGVWKFDKRMQAADGKDHARGFELPVKRDRSAGAQQVVQLTAKAVDAPPTIDGVLNEPLWAEAQRTGAFVNTMSGGPAAFSAWAKTAWDAKNLYVAFDVDDHSLTAPDTKHDDPLWRQDCVEIMLDPNGNGRNYFELQVSPTGVVFDTRYDSRRQPRPSGHLDWNSELVAAVAARGSVNDDKVDAGYSVEIAIPWQAFAPYAKAPALTAQEPATPTTWRANFYVMDRSDAGQLAAAWSPPLVGDFHMPPRFGRLHFVPKTASTVTP